MCSPRRAAATTGGEQPAAPDTTVPDTATSVEPSTSVDDTTTSDAPSTSVDETTTTTDETTTTVVERLTYDDIAKFIEETNPTITVGEDVVNQDGSIGSSVPSDTISPELLPEPVVVTTPATTASTTTEAPLVPSTPTNPYLHPPRKTVGLPETDALQRSRFGPEMLSADEAGRWVPYVYTNPALGTLSNDSPLEFFPLGGGSCPTRPCPFP